MATASWEKASFSTKPSQEATCLTAIGKIYLPLEGLIDVEAEKERLGKELAKAEDELRERWARGAAVRVEDCVSEGRA